MDVSPPALLRNFVPRIPAILFTSVAAVLGQTANSPEQDALTQTIIAAARPILRTPAQIARSQKVWRFIGDWSAWAIDLASKLGVAGLIGLGGVRVHKEIFGAGGASLSKESMREGLIETESGRKVMDVRRAIAFAFEVLCDSKHGTIECPMPDLVDVEVEWITPAARRDIYPSPRTTGSKQDAIILYLHGGAHCLMDPTTHRWTASTLSKLSSVDVCNVRFRLSPQSPFPAALIDAFIAYLTLIAPPTKSGRPTIDPSHIVVAGDSSGGGMAASLVLLLLTLSRNQVDVRFHDSVVQISESTCAGLALTSPWVDITRSLPSTSQNARWDVIAPPPLDSASPPFPPDEVWPSNPPRAETYCIASICTHPLVSPLAAKAEQWIGAPPAWVCTGWEACTDETEVFARRIFQSSSDACVLFRGWEGMPHCFGMVPWNKAGWDALTEWARFCSEVLDRRVPREDNAVWHSTARRNKAIAREMRMDNLGCEKTGVGYVRSAALTDPVVDQLMEAGRNWRIELEYELAKSWKARSGSSSNR